MSAESAFEAVAATTGNEETMTTTAVAEPSDPHSAARPLSSPL